MYKVLVLDTNKKPLTPCTPKRARLLLKQKKAAVYRKFPFTLILKSAKEDAQPRSIRLKIDPGSKKTGMALVVEETKEVVQALELEHRGLKIKSDMDARRAVRRGRRNRKTRYRQPRFENRTRKEGWLAPSLESRVANIQTWVKRLQQLAPIEQLSMELVRFDLQKMENPEVQGVEYQQGELQGYEVREYLLEKWGRTCAYCQAKDVPLEVEHIVPKSKGGSDRVSNLTLACRACNQKKGNRSLSEFLAKKPELLKKIESKMKRPLRDASAINSTRWELYRRLSATGLPVETGSGGRTKFNRSTQKYAKTHWIDACCVGKSGAEVQLDPEMKVLQVKSMGRGSRQMCRMNKYGFPRTKAKSVKTVHGFHIGDLVTLNQSKGKYKGLHRGVLAGIRARGDFDIKTEGQKITASFKNFILNQHGNGYSMSLV